MRTGMQDDSGSERIAGLVTEPGQMTAVVCTVAAFAAVVSYSHIYGLGRAYGQDGTAARLQLL